MPDDFIIRIAANYEGKMIDIDGNEFISYHDGEGWIERIGDKYVPEKSVMIEAYKKYVSDFVNNSGNEFIAIHTGGQDAERLTRLALQQDIAENVANGTATDFNRTYFKMINGRDIQEKDDPVIISWLLNSAISMAVRLSTKRLINWVEEELIKAAEIEEIVTVHDGCKVMGQAEVAFKEAKEKFPNVKTMPEAIEMRNEIMNQAEKVLSLIGG